MKIKVLSCILCLIMIVSLFTGCGGTGQTPENGTAGAGTNAVTSTANAENASTAPQTKTAKTYDEFLTVDVFDSQANYQGIQAGWFAKIVKDKFNMELNMIAPNVAGGGDTLYQTRTAAGNLGDLIIYQMNSGKLQDLVTAGLITDMSKMIDAEENLTKYRGAIDYSNKSNCTEPGTWAIPSEVSVNPATKPFGGTTLNFGQYTRWDAYKQLGYPEVNTLEDMLPVMKQIQGIVPKSESGKKTYGFSIFKDWDGNSMMAASTIAQMYGFDTMGFLMVKADDSTPPVSIIADDSAYVRGLKFYFAAKQQGLLDPESSTQNWDTVWSKYADGATLCAPCPWMVGGFNTDERKAAGKYYDTISVKDIKYEVWGCYAKGNPGCSVMVGSKAKDPGRLVDFIDWLYSPEGISIVATGEQGLTWDMVDGQPKLTDLGIKCMTDEANTQMPQEKGSGTYKDGKPALNYKIVSAGETNPNTGFPYDYTLWDSWTQRNLSPMEKDWQEHMGAKNAFEYFIKNNMICVNPGSGFSTPAESADITTLRNQIKEVIKDYSWKAIYAKDENAFNNYLKQMRDTANGLGLDKVLAVDQATAEAQKQARAAVSK